MENILALTEEQAERFLEFPLIDVRAPVEFQESHLPTAVNLPILSNEERALVGICYKNKGAAAAIELGRELVSGAKKESRIQSWIDFLQKNPDAKMYCYRGGLRSQTAKAWLHERSIDVETMPGGFKAARQFLNQKVVDFAQTQNLLIVSGTTGSGKTSLIHQVQEFYPVVDLEALAKHRGSSFGALMEPQPTQKQFEIYLANELFKSVSNLPVLVEDESRLIGKNVIPESFFNLMRSSRVILIEEPLRQRIDNIFADYIQGPANLGQLDYVRLKKSLDGIQKKLGGLRHSEVLQLMQIAEQEYVQTQNLESNKAWIEKLLLFYYDPLYLNSLARREVVIAFKGNRLECAEFLKIKKLKSLKEDL